RTRRMRDIADDCLVADVAHSVIGANILEAGKQRQPDHVHWRKFLGAWLKTRLPRCDPKRELPIRAKAVGRPSLIIRLDDHAFIGELGLKMHGLSLGRT